MSRAGIGAARGVLVAALTALGLSACVTAGNAWVEDADLEDDDELPPASLLGPGGPAGHRGGVAPRTIGGEPPPRAPVTAAPAAARAPVEGRVLGKFRNTYYDFPAERDFDGAPTTLFDADCDPIRDVPRGFHDAICVQGSGTLSSGATVSFARRDCKCARVCPRTDQKICFEALDPARFPWGRGATGRAITPLLTVAVDSDVIPLHTPLYILEYDGLPRDEARTTPHDGCFVAQDRGSKVKGQHIDVFTGSEAMTRLWNKLVPSNQGITVVLDHPRCARGGAAE